MESNYVYLSAWCCAPLSALLWTKDRHNTKMYVIFHLDMHLPFLGGAFRRQTSWCHINVFIVAMASNTILTRCVIELEKAMGLHSMYVRVIYLPK